MTRPDGGPAPIDGVSTIINNRHAFVHERLLELIVRETQQGKRFSMSKRELARLLSCTVQSIENAVSRLASEELVARTFTYSDTGSQRCNAYQATQKGIARARSYHDRNRLLLSLVGKRYRPEDG